jgi:geranylgeranyl transferase type-1 subunit beta
MALAFFILSALDILGAGADTLPLDDVASYRSWILGCQHPSGGFCGSPAHRYPDEYYDEFEEINIDPPNLAATYFAILSLNFTGGLEEVKRSKCLRFVKSLHREDGSFGQVLGRDGKIEGGRDMRNCHFASTIRWILRGDLEPSTGDFYEDIDVDKLVRHIRNGEVCFPLLLVASSVNF